MLVRCDLSRSNIPDRRSSLGSLIWLLADTDKERKLLILRRSISDACFFMPLGTLKLGFLGICIALKFTNCGDSNRLLDVVSS